MLKEEKILFEILKSGKMQELEIDQLISNVGDMDEGISKE
jgi:hypothetical protein